MKIEVIKIDDLIIHENHLDMIYSANQFKFSTKVFYNDVSFSRLRENYAHQVIDRIAAYIALFEGMKLCSLFPDYYDVSLIAEHLSLDTLKFFAKIYAGVFSQHWYENQVTDYPGPQLIFPDRDLGKNQITAEILGGDSDTILTGCGGGKDSVLAMKMFQEAEICFASMQYSHSAYGKEKIQHNFISQSLEYFNPIRKHKIWIYDDFVDDPFLSLYFPQNSGITVPATPISLFQSLFIAMNWGYKYLNLSHEKSANTGNLFWKEIGKEVNHQWGKSFEAETLLNHFVQDNLLSNFTYFSILKPIYDFRIFKNLARYPETIQNITSCNVDKPWCKKCPKCAYVWLGFMANLPTKIVDEIFQKNLFDDPDLFFIFKQMLGLTEHSPFECIGEISESRLYMKKCLENGLSGEVLDLFQKEILSDDAINWQELEHKYNQVYETEHAIPDWIFNQLRSQF
jgi:UDP-N-acetyl-alpha-D-muramoyl-L-alanyl-L-glutamate epimerase